MQLESLERFLQGPASRAHAVYILGDLFEQFWIGTDDDNSIHQAATGLLADYTRKTQIPLFVLPGNRDLYLDQRFAAITGCRLINGPLTIELDRKKILLLHGDTLCTRDIAYQYYRKLSTLSLVKTLFMQSPLALRQFIVNKVRAYTKRAVASKPKEITDVSQDAVIKLMQHHQVSILIHGHTHRQGEHHFKINNQPVRRIVLADWYQQGSALVYSKGVFQFFTIEECIARF